MSVTVEGGGSTRICASGGYCAEWDAGRCDLASSPAGARFGTAIPTPLAQGSRRLMRLAVRHMRRGALRQLLGRAVAEVERDQEFVDLTLEDVSVGEVIAMLGHEPAGLRLRSRHRVNVP